MITLFSQLRCPYSNATKLYLQSHSIPFTEFDYSSSRYRPLAQLFSYSKRPLIVVDLPDGKLSFIKGHREISSFDLHPSTYESFLTNILKDRLYDNPSIPSQ